MTKEEILRKLKDLCGDDERLFSLIKHDPGFEFYSWIIQEWSREKRGEESE